MTENKVTFAYFKKVYLISVYLLAALVISLVFCKCGAFIGCFIVEKQISLTVMVSVQEENVNTIFRLTASLVFKGE